MSKRCMGCMNVYDEQYDVCPYCGYVDGTPAKEAYHLIPGTLLHGKYIVGKVIGYGGFGVTYVGWDNVLEQKVAIKEYLPGEFATRVTGEENITVYSGEKAHQFEIGREKFSDEARRLAQFNSVEGVVEIKDTFRENDTAYIVMEFLEGETLKARLEREKKLSPEEAIPIIKEILMTLEKVHEGNIIHRDISPDNIFLCEDGRVKLLDFGAARYATVQHSKSLSVILKEGYAPEEQYRSKGEQGSWSDVYAVAATMYKMLTGVTPEDAMERAENDRLKPVSKYGVKLSKVVNTAMMNALNVFPEDRTKTAAEFMTELEADDVKRKERTRKKIDIGKWPLWSKIAIGCVAAALATTGVLLSRSSVYALDEGQAYVPEIINLSEEDAQKKIEKNELTMKIIGQEKTDKVQLGHVMTQYPDAGRIVNIGELVEAKVSAGNTAEMVDLSGMTRDEAEEVLKTLGFTDVEFVEAESGVEAGAIVSQNIEAGKEAKAGDKIVITVSGGLTGVDSSVSVKVPTLTGMTFEEAAEKATKSKLYVRKGQNQASSQPAGTVISQNVSAGTSVKEGTTITLTISIGEQKVSVPYVQYLSESEAKNLLAAYGLKASISYKNSDTVNAGLVISQSEVSGKKVKPGTTVKLVVSEGRQQITVPSTVGMSYDTAAQTLVDKGFRYTTVYTHSDSAAWGDVISASPGGKQEAGTKITLTVSKGTSGQYVTENEYKSKYSDSGKYQATKMYAFRSRTRDKEYTYSPQQSLNGWTRDGGRIQVGEPEGSLWLDSNKNAWTGTKIEGDYEVEVTKEKSVCYVSYAYFCDCYRFSSPNKGVYSNSVSTHKKYGCDGKSKHSLRVSSRNSVTSFDKSSLGGYEAPHYFSQANPGGFGHIYKITLDGETITNKGFTSNQKTGFSHLWPDSGPFDVYKTWTTKYHYKYWRWSDWSEWSEWDGWYASDRNLTNTDNKQQERMIKYYIKGIEPK